MKSFHEARELGLLEAKTELPNNYDTAMDELFAASKLDWKLSPNHKTARVPTKFKILKGFDIYNFNIEYDKLTITFGFWDGENCKFHQNNKMIDTLKELLNKSGLNFEFTKYGVDGKLNLRCDLPRKLDLKTYKSLQKLMTNVLTEKNLNTALKSVIGDVIPTVDLVEGFFKAAKLKVSSKKDIGVFNEWTIKSKDVNADYEKLVKIVQARSTSNSSSALKITFPLQFMKYISISKEDPEQLVVKTYS